MKAVLSGKEMKEFDARSIKGYGIPSLVLMERAAMAVAEKAEEILEKEEAGTRGSPFACRRSRSV